MKLERLIKKYQGIYYRLTGIVSPLPCAPGLITAPQRPSASEIALNIVNDLIALQTEVKQKLEAMKKPTSHLNPVIILKELIE